MDKTWMDVLIQVIEALVGLLVTAGIPYLFTLLRSKVKHEKVRSYLYRAEDYLAAAVAMVNQTFVDQLKKDGQFNAEAQNNAFQMAMDTWTDMMGEEMKNVIMTEVGDFYTWAETQIEAKVNELKK